MTFRPREHESTPGSSMLRASCAIACSKNSTCKGHRAEMSLMGALGKKTQKQGRIDSGSALRDLN